MTFLESSLFNLLPYNINFSLLEDLSVIRTDLTFLSEFLINSEELDAIRDARMFNFNIFSFDDTGLVTKTTYESYSDIQLEIQLSPLGLTREDFFNVFPSQTLKKAIENSLDINLVHSLANESLEDYAIVEAVRSQFHNSVPLKKMQYPEPFIASASFIHTDIGFVHVLQYNY